MKLEQNLSIEHKEKVCCLLKNLNNKLSEFSFANLYLFRKLHQYKYIEENNYAGIVGITHDKKSFFIPLSNACFNDENFLADMIKRYGMIYPVSQEQLAFFDKEKFNVTNNENDSDYVYAVEKFATYAGRHLHKKRNLLKQFHELYIARYEKITEENCNLAKNVLDQWMVQTNQEGKTDYDELCEALKMIDELSLEGLLFFVQDVPIGFVLGEQIEGNVFVFHFAKALTFYKGVYQYMFNEYAKTLVGRAHYINLEQDLGLEPLRHSKKSYMPDHMEEKFRVTLFN